MSWFCVFCVLSGVCLICEPPAAPESFGDNGRTDRGSERRNPVSEIHAGSRQARGDGSGAGVPHP